MYAAASDTNGIYALVKLPSNSQYALTVSQAGYSNATGHWSTGTSQNGAATTGNVWGANFVLSALGPNKHHIDKASLLRSTRLNTSPIWVLSTAKGLTSACREALSQAGETSWPTARCCRSCRRAGP